MNLDKNKGDTGNWQVGMFKISNRQDFMWLFSKIGNKPANDQISDYSVALFFKISSFCV